MATSIIIFLCRVGQEEKKGFLAQQKDLGEQATSTIFFSSLGFLPRCLDSCWCVQCFEKILVTSFVLSDQVWRLSVLSEPAFRLFVLSD